MTIDSGTYRQWIERFDSFDAEDLRAAVEFGRSLSPRPQFDVVMPVHDPPVAFLEQAIASIRAQTYDDWRLYIVDDGSTREPIRRVLEHAEGDARIRVRRFESAGGIARAINSALGLGSAEFVVFFDHDDVLPRHALVTVADWLARAPATNLLYSDFDFIDEAGSRTNPFFKPDYDHDLHLGLNVVSSLTVYRRSLLAQLNGMREGYSGSEDYDLSLRAVEAIDERTITHVPHVLYHWRIVQTSLTKTKLASAVEGARRAVGEHCRRIGVPSGVEGTARSLIWNRVRALSPSPPPITLALSTPSPEALKRLQARTHYAALSFVDSATLPALGSFRNAVVRDAKTEFVAFVDPELVPRDPGWLGELASHFMHPRTAAVGARILRDGTVVHAGIVLGRDSATTACAGVPDADANYFGTAEIAHRVAAVAGGVIVVRKGALDQIGGFDESITDPTLLDVELCLCLRARGYAVVLNPYAVFDSIRQNSPESQCATLMAELGSSSRFVMSRDPYYNPNLSSAADYGLAFPPRVRFPWAAKSLSQDRIL